MKTAAELLRLPPSVEALSRAQMAFDDFHIALPAMDDRIRQLLADKPADKDQSPPSAQQAEFVTKYAERIADVLFSDSNVLEEFARCLNQTQDRRARLRVWLECPGTQIEVAEVPWELVRLGAQQWQRCREVGARIEDDERHLALHPDLAFLRTFSGTPLADAFFDETSDRDPVRVLIAIADLNELGAEEVASADVQRTSIERIVQEEAPGLFAAPKVLEHATPATLESAIADYTPHVVQLICHGKKAGYRKHKRCLFRNRG